MGLGLYLFEEGFSLKVLNWFIRLRFLSRWAWEPEEMLESWSVSVYGDQFGCLHLRWGRRYKFLHLFGQWKHVRHDVMKPDGSFVPYVASYEVSDTKPPDGRWEETHPYRYCLRKSSWEVQQRQATINVQEREWRWQLPITKLVLPFPKKVSRSLYIDFNDEVGERTGSWKGGTMGCGYSLKPDETPLECLRRMEQERDF